MPSTLRLNPAQKTAVEFGEGPLLIIAGPGSGKTRVITERIVHLLATVEDLHPENILALTFTDKAAGEMRDRVAKALPGLVASPHISTFHSFCYEVLRQRHYERRLLDKIEVWIFLRRRMEALALEHYRKLAEPGAFLHALNDFFSRCQDELIEPEDFESHVQRLEEEFVSRAPALDPTERKVQQEELRKKRELASVFRKSRELIEGAGCSSLGSLISETARLFDREPEILAGYRARFRYFLVDEFQDTNYGQVELLRRLIAPPFNITAVGDDDQAIYRFRGASHGAFQMFDLAFPGHETVYLDRNYRSTQRILRAADCVIAKNDRYAKKPGLKTEKGEGPSVYIFESPDYLSEAVGIADEVARLAKGGTPFADIAILYRAHNYRDLLVDQFRHRKIPFAIRGLSILSTIIIRDLLSYLNVIHSPHDNISLTRVLLMPRWRFPEELALEIRLAASRDRCSLYDVLESRERASVNNLLARTGWAELRVFLREFRAFAARAPVTVLFDRLIDRLCLSFLPHDPEQGYVNIFRKFLEDWELKSETQKLAEFQEYFRYFLEAGGKIEPPEPKGPAEAVQMMTVHAAKGLEFPVVFVLSVAPRRFPSTEHRPVIEFPDELRRAPSPPADIHLQEERRLFYVALTRAKERLYVSSVVKPPRKPSVLIDDLLSDPVVAARDIQHVQVAEAKEAPPVLGVPPVSASPTHPQQSLFAGPSDGGSVHPPIAAWAGRSPALPDGEKIKLSASAIEDYLDCPLKFKFSHYLKIPAGPQAALTFGNIMHQCVRRYFELRQANLPRFEDIEAFYLSAWRGTGFEDDYQEQAYKKAGLEQLRAFLETQNGKTIDAHGVRLEEYFQLELDAGLILEGRIDQVNPLQSGAVELVDYKTGRPKSQKEADKSLQLSVYAIAAREQLKLSPARLTFYSLTNNEPISSVRSPKNLENVKAEIREVADQIRQKLFPPKPGFVCKFCDYMTLCPVHEDTF
jgi:DNA helicase-2/ATP-dependent DNA helicase PcrA